MSRDYTITEALQELKLLSSRISKITNGTVFVSTLRSEDIKNKELVCKDSASNYQSVSELITRRAKIKSAIMQSNATTSVEIGGKTYTVAEAIATKEYIKDKEVLLNVLKNQKVNVSNQVNNYNTDRQRKIDALINSSFGRDSSQKNNSEDISTITDMYVKKNFIELIDPIKIDDKIKELEEEIESFKHQVDYKLSYINAITKINI